MLTTVENVKALTGYDVTPEVLFMAQALIESFSGKMEGAVDSANDLALLGRATAYQAAYMVNNYDKVFEQAAMKYMMQSDSAISPNADMAAPFIAPLAIFTLSNLSWRRSRGIKTGRMFGTETPEPWERD